MKKLTALSSLVVIAVFVFFTNTTQADFVAGKDYVVLDKAVKTDTGDKIEVRELFWYYCGHCYNFEPYVENWLQTMDSRAEFIRQPAVFSDKWQSGAIFYFVLRHLNEFDRLNSALFNAIHQQGIKFSNQQDFVTWLTLNGVDEDQANEAFESFTVAVNVNKAKSNTYKYRVNGVPVGSCILFELWRLARPSGCGVWLWQLAAAPGCGLRLWALAVGPRCGLWLWALAVVSGCGLWLLSALAVGSGCGF